MRRVGYGNSTHLNMSVIVGGDNKAIIQVALDRQDKDYFACDAGKFWVVTKVECTYGDNQSPEIFHISVMPLAGSLGGF